MNRLRHLTWAVDVMSDPDLRSKPLSFLRALSQSTKIKIDPVYVLRRPESDTRAAFQALAEKNMKELKKECGLANLSLGEVLIEKDGSLKKTVERVTEFAQSRGSDGIVISTHAKTGLARWLAGSFAEILLLSSPLSTLTANPLVQVRKKIRSILFPTDFSPGAREGFESTVDFAKKGKAQLTLFYKEPSAMIPSYFGAPLAPMALECSEEEKKERTETSKTWLHWAKQRGVRTRLEMDNVPGDVAAAIDQVAVHKDIDLISIVTRSEPLSSALIGSIVRRTVWEAPCPVWIQREHQIAA